MNKRILAVDPSSYGGTCTWVSVLQEGENYRYLQHGTFTVVNDVPLTWLAMTGYDSFSLEIVVERGFISQGKVPNTVKENIEVSAMLWGARPSAEMINAPLASHWLTKSQWTKRLEQRADFTLYRKINKIPATRGTLGDTALRKYLDNMSKNGQFFDLPKLTAANTGLTDALGMCLAV